MICDNCKWHEWHIIVCHSCAKFVDECPFHPNRTGEEVTECEDYEVKDESIVSNRSIRYWRKTD